MTRIWRRASAILAILVLVVTAYAGITDGLNSLRRAATNGQQVAAATQLAYGFLGIAALVAIALGFRATTYILIAWGLAATFTAAIAPTVWGGAPMQAGIASGLGAGLVAAVVILGGRRLEASRSLSRPTIQ